MTEHDDLEARVARLERVTLALLDILNTRDTTAQAQRGAFDILHDVMTDPEEVKS